MSAPRTLLFIGLAVAVAGLVGWAALGRSPETQFDRAGAPSRPVALVLVTGGVPSPVVAGQPVGLAKGIVATALTLDARGKGHYDLKVTLREPSGAPIADARVTASVEMRTMDHSVAEFTGAGHVDGAYLVPVDFGMPGDWSIRLAVEWRGTSGAIRLDAEELP